MKYKIELGHKKVNDLLRQFDLGFNTKDDGIISQELIATLTTSTPLSEELIEKHKKGLKESLSEHYFVGKITYIN